MITFTGIVITLTSLMLTFTGVSFIIKGIYYLEPISKEGLYRGGTIMDIFLGISLILVGLTIKLLY